MKCPNCGLENPDSAIKCDCGYNFDKKSKESNMVYCSNCGKEIDEKAFICPHCGVKTNFITQDDGPIGGLGILCFFFPIIGLILYIIWQENKPNKSKSAGKSALWGFIISMVFWFFVGLAGG